MSCYGEERGTITIPSKEFKSYKDNMVSNYQSKMTSLYESAVIIYKEMKAMKLKGKIQLGWVALPKVDVNINLNNYLVKLG